MAEGKSEDKPGRGIEPSYFQHSQDPERVAVITDPGLKKAMRIVGYRLVTPTDRRDQGSLVSKTWSVNQVG